MRFYDLMCNHAPVSLRDYIQSDMHIIEAISNFIEIEEDNHRRGTAEKVTPRMELILSAFNLVSFDIEGLFPNSLKVVFMFQDVYKQPNLACGVATCTLNGIAQPTLKNIFKRLSETYKLPDENPMKQYTDGDIRGWATQGILLWNAALTTREHQTESHILHWSIFTKRMIKWISDRFPYLIFVFFGKKAQEYQHIIDESKHKSLSTSHPSPLGYNYGFHETNVFNEINQHLTLNKRDPIKWENHTYI